MNIEFAPLPGNPDSTISFAGTKGTDLDHGPTEWKQEPAQLGTMQRARQKECYLSAADPGNTSDEKSTRPLR